MLTWLWRLLIGCKHTWKTMDVKDMESCGEIAMETAGMVSQYPCVYRRLHVHTMTCTKCGKVKTTRSKTPV